MVVKCLHHAIKMRCCSEQDKHVEDLMGAAPDIEYSWKVPLRPSSHINTYAKEIHGAVYDDPGNADSVLEPLIAVDGDTVDNRNEAG